MTPIPRAARTLLTTALVVAGSMLVPAVSADASVKSAGPASVASATPSSGAIGAKYTASGGRAGTLGSPTSGEIGGLTGGGAYEVFQGGVIVWSPASGAHISKGAIRAVYGAAGFERGSLGYPTSDEVGGLTGGGVYQAYQGGVIVWSPATGAHISKGAIRGAYGAAGFERGSLGYPTSDEVGGLKNGGVYQMYQGGAIMWSPATGAHVSKGAIRLRYSLEDFERGPQGYPIGDEVTVQESSSTVVYQQYQGGWIFWTSGAGVGYDLSNEFAARLLSGDTLARLGGGPSGEGMYVLGATNLKVQYQIVGGAPFTYVPGGEVHIMDVWTIENTWDQDGGPQSPLGWPTSDAYKNSAGLTAQDFQHGTIVSPDLNSRQSTYIIRR